jgi:SAM-dependent methyltransferase
MYDSARLAAGYAFDRPPVHEQILRQVSLPARALRALDIGCGAGRSTAALGDLAETVIGLEPMGSMLAHRRAVAPAASFVVGAAERLPFQAFAFDLVAAAGSLNYVDMSRFLPELLRVLTPGGLLVIYDFSEGRRAFDDGQLAAWFDSFERRYPWPPGYESFDVREIPFAQHGLRLGRYERLEVTLPMGLDAYLRYVLSDVNVEMACRNGVPEPEIRAWCRETLAAIFADEPIDILFAGYVACVFRAIDTPWFHRTE